jgi:hypothetical protein
MSMNIAQLTALINTNLASASNILAAELRQVLIAMLGGDYVTGTHAEIRALKTGNQLKVNTAYLITDFQTIYDRPDYEDVGGNIVPKMTIATVTAAVEPLLLFATSPNTFSPYAFSPSNPQDIIQYDIDYVQTFVNNAAAKGKIIYRECTIGKQVFDFDWRNVTVKRYDRGGDGIFKWYWDSGTDDFDILPTITDCQGVDFRQSSYVSALTTAFDVPNIRLNSLSFTNYNVGLNVTIHDGGGNTGFLIENSTIGNGFDNNRVVSIRDCVIGDNFRGNSMELVVDCTIGDDMTGNIFVILFEVIIGNDFRRNSGIQITTEDLSAATIVYQNGSKQILQQPDGTYKIQWIDNTGTIQINDITD